MIRRLRDEADDGDLEDFKFIEVNGMRLTDPDQAFVRIWKELTGKKATAKHAQVSFLHPKMMSLILKLPGAIFKKIR